MTENLLSNIKKSLAVFCLAGAVAFAPVCQANARSPYGETIVAAAIGGAVAGLVGGVVQASSAPILVSQPVIYEPEPIVVAPVVIHRPHRHYMPVRYVRHYHRYYY